MNTQKPQWQQTVREGVSARWASLYVSMNPKGMIVMSRHSWEQLGSPEAFLILFDKTNSRIGLAPTSPITKNAFRARKCGRYGARRAHAYLTMQQFGIVLSDTVRFFDATINEDGMMVLDLRTAQIDARVRNHPQNRKRRQKEA